MALMSTLVTSGSGIASAMANPADAAITAARRHADTTAGETLR